MYVIHNLYIELQKDAGEIVEVHIIYSDTVKLVDSILYIKP